MSALTTIVTIAAYASLVFELCVLHVPSVASSRQIWSPRMETVAGFSPRYRRLFALGGAARVLLTVPLLINIAVFLYPVATLCAGGDLLGDFLYEPTAPVQALAIALMTCGRALTILAALSMRAASTSAQATETLRTDGIYSFSRNPGLVGMYVFVAGLWAASPSAALLAGVAHYIAYMHFKVRMEEDYLLQKFGNSFTDYCSKTSRYVGP